MAELMHRAVEIPSHWTRIRSGELGQRQTVRISLAVVQNTFPHNGTCGRLNEDIDGRTHESASARASPAASQRPKEGKCQFAANVASERLLTHVSEFGFEER